MSQNHSDLLSYRAAANKLHSKYPEHEDVEMREGMRVSDVGP